MEFIQTNPLTSQVVTTIQNQKIDDYQPFLYHFKRLLEKGHQCLKSIQTQARHEETEAGSIDLQIKHFIPTKYVYYTCTNTKDNCQRKYIHKEKLLETLTPYFSSLQLPDDLIDKITDYLKNIHESESLFHKENSVLGYRHVEIAQRWPASIFTALSKAIEIGRRSDIFNQSINFIFNKKKTCSLQKTINPLWTYSCSY